MLRRGLSGSGSTLLLLCSSFVSGGCSPSPTVGSPDSPRVALIGWDGATWDVIDPMLRQGRLPHLAGLIRRGSRSVLVAGQPILSPVAWTTLATGFSPSEHGVTGFLLPNPRGPGQVLAATYHRRRAALWQMVSAHGKSVGFVGWWTTWPAEAVRGYLVSDHLAYNRWDAWAPRAEGVDDRLAYPGELERELRPLAVAPGSVARETLTAIVPFSEPEQQEMMQAERPVLFHAPSVFRFGYSTDASSAAFARHLLETRPQPDLFAVVFILSDVAGHVFWHHYHPEAFPAAGPDAGRLSQAIPNVYEQLDAWTGEVLERLDPATRVIVLSDHGMRPTGELPRPGRNPAGDHAPEGIFVASGGGIPQGKDLGRLSSLDLAPTLLALLNLPVARDMPGRVAEELFVPGAAGTRQWLASYGDGRSDREAIPPASPADDAYRERLRSLGYVR